MILISLCLITVFLINFIIYIIIIVRDKAEISKFGIAYQKIFPIIWVLTLYPIPLLNSSLLILIFPKNISYFNQYWIWFLPLGIIFIISGVKIISSTRKLLKDKKSKGLEFKILNDGIYKVMRFPQYTAQILIFLGITLVLDSFIGLILCPILFTILELKSFIEETFIISPKIGEELEVYKRKTPNRIFPNPFNYLVIIISVLVVYIGFLSLLP